MQSRKASDLQCIDVATYSAANGGAWSTSLISNATAPALLWPCARTNSSSLSFRRPTAVTLIPAVTRRSAIAFPIPEVAPIMRTCLYGKAIVR